MRKKCWQMRWAALLAVVLGAAGCSSSPPDQLTEQQLQAQLAQEKQNLADEDAAEAAFQKGQKKQRR